VIWLLATALAGPRRPVPVCPEAAQKQFVGGLDGWLFRTPDLQARFDLDLTVAQRLGRLVRAIEERGTEVVVHVVPSRALVVPTRLPYDTAFDLQQAEQTYSDLQHWIRAIGARPVDLLRAAREAERPYYHKTDHHWTSAGARVSAHAVAQVIRSTEGWAETPRMEHESRFVKKDSVRARQAQVLHELCGGWRLPKEDYNLFETGPVEPPTLGLLDEAPAAPVITLGSSFGQPRFNFGGYLEDDLDVDVLNVWTGGGGTMVSIFNYLHSPDWRKEAPRYVVWEWLQSTLHLPSTANATLPFQDAPVYRELIAAAHGDCESPAVDETVQLTGGRQTLVRGLGPQGLHGPQSWIVLDTKGPLPELTLVSRYADATSDRHSFERYDRAKRNRRYHLELSDRHSAALLLLEAITPDGTDIGAHLRICTGDEP